MSKVFKIVEMIRSEIEALKYVALDDIALMDMKSAVALGVSNNAIEDSVRTDEEVALDEMLFEMRAPYDVRDFASRRFIEESVMDGQSLKGKMYADCPY